MPKQDVLIIGAGPAGIAAACAAGELGAAVRVIDDNPANGGQIWRGGKKKHQPKQALKWFNRFEKCGATLFAGTQVLGIVSPGTLLVETRGAVEEVTYEKLILATGARELFLPFPGWTLPGIMGCGGTQAMVKNGLPIRGKRVVIAGSGPLLLAAAEHLKSEGATVLMIAEQTDFGKLFGFGLGLLASPGKLIQAAGLKMKLMGVPFRAGSWAARAEAAADGLNITVQTGAKRKTLTCDYLGCAFGLVPNLEMARSLGCSLRADGTVDANQRQQTSVENIFAAGEITGIGGVDKSLMEGLVAGTAAAEGNAEAHFAKRDATAGFASRLNAAFALRDEVKKLATAETIICRCEDVRLGQLTGYRSAREAKLQARCGMGACQGRICGAIVREVMGWTDGSVRPPIFSAPVNVLLPVSEKQKTADE